MKVFLAFGLILLAGQLVSQTPNKALCTILNSPGSPIQHEVHGCGMAKKCTGKKLLDSLQVALNEKNSMCSSKEYFYYIEVYRDSSFRFKKEYRWPANTISGDQYRRSAARQ